jgi:hypothetical protein
MDKAERELDEACEAAGFLRDEGQWMANEAGSVMVYVDPATCRFEVLPYSRRNLKKDFGTAAEAVEYAQSIT